MEPCTWVVSRFGGVEAWAVRVKVGPLREDCLALLKMPLDSDMLLSF